MGAAGQPDLDAYLCRTASGELVWELHGVIYESHDKDHTLTLRRENRALILTMAADSPGASSATMRSSDARDDDQRDKWEQLMALVETHAI